MDFNNMLKTHGVKYSIKRTGNITNEYTGLPNTEKSTNKKYIGFDPTADVKTNDQIINPVGEKLYIIDTQTQIIRGLPFQLKAYYITEAEHIEKHSLSPNTVFNIGNVYNSIIGNNNTNTINCTRILSDIKSHSGQHPDDKEQLDEIIALLNLITEEKIHPTKGLFSKFSSLMEKHSWLSSSIASFVLNYLLQP